MYPYKLEKIEPDLAFALAADARAAIERHTPHLRADFPSWDKWDFQHAHNDNVVVIKMAFNRHQIPFAGGLERIEFENIIKFSSGIRSFQDLFLHKSLKEYYSAESFLLVLDIYDGHIDWHAAQRVMYDWIETQLLPRALQMNIQRIQGAIPTPPQYSFSSVQSAMWVLECDETCVQGTAFDLSGYGTVTNHHVVDGAVNMKAFRADKLNDKYDVDVISSNSALDLALIKVVDASFSSPLIPSGNETTHMSHVAVCGFPNFRLGDSGVLTPGLIVGTRPKSGIQRLLTNAPIIAGMSGGPAIGADGNVLGVCATGAKTIQGAPDTEDHSIIPISALDILISA